MENKEKELLETLYKMHLDQLSQYSVPPMIVSEEDFKRDYYKFKQIYMPGKICNLPWYRKLLNYLLKPFKIYPQEK